MGRNFMAHTRANENRVLKTEIHSLDQLTNFVPYHTINYIYFLFFTIRTFYNFQTPTSQRKIIRSQDDNLKIKKKKTT